MSMVFFNLRIDEELNERLVKIAAEEGRSKNKQIEYILKEYVKKYEQSNGAINITQSHNESATVNIK
ncbi:MAG: toxin-antitoxin system HicB family antitoxin [Lachnospiraceae bacterium]|nr:toxin-antitoxin system HicB family antitoxin [Ruminococcus sp.]MCM1275236.1 toxin-antitoxin system HicB family antitoxin [Lachnospiraceae bacterium]